MLYLFEHPVGQSEHEIVREPLTLMHAAEIHGFDSVWPAEHHFREVLRSMDLMGTAPA